MGVGDKVGVTFFVRSIRGELGPWNAVREQGGAPYLVPGCSSRDSALRRLLGALQVDPVLRHHAPRIFPDAAGGYVVQLHAPEVVGGEIHDPASAGLRVGKPGTRNLQTR